MSETLYIDYTESSKNTNGRQLLIDFQQTKSCYLLVNKNKHFYLSCIFQECIMMNVILPGVCMYVCMFITVNMKPVISASFLTDEETVV